MSNTKPTTERVLQCLRCLHHDDSPPEWMPKDDVELIAVLEVAEAAVQAMALRAAYMESAPGSMEQGARAGELTRAERAYFDNFHGMTVKPWDAK